MGGKRENYRKKNFFYLINRIKAVTKLFDFIKKKKKNVPNLLLFPYFQIT